MRDDECRAGPDEDAEGLLRDAGTQPPVERSAGCAPGSPLRVLNPRELGVDLNRALEESLRRSGVAEGPRARKPGRSARPGAAQRWARTGMILAGCAMCIGATRLGQSRFESVQVPSAAAGAGALPNRTNSAPRGAIADTTAKRAGVPMRIVDDAWKAQPGTVTRIDVPIRGVRVPPRAEGEVRFVDEQGREQRRAATEVLALLPVREIGAEPGALTPAPETPTPAAPETGPSEPFGDGFIELTDGQRWFGRLTRIAAAEPTGPDEIRWTSDVLGSLSVPLDRVHRVVFSRREPGAADATATASAAGETDAAKNVQDRVLLRNGDRVAGLVDSLVVTPGGAASIRIDLGQGRVSTIDVGDVLEVELTNPPVEPRGVLASLSDGSLVRMESVDADGARVQAHIAGLSRGLPQAEADVKLSTGRSAGDPGRVSLAMEDVRALILDAQRVRPLSTLRVLEQRPAPERRWGMGLHDGRSDIAAMLGLTTIRLPGPMTVRWALPAGAQRVVFRAVIDAADAPWADCTLTIGAAADESGANPRELARVRLSAQRPSEPLNVELPVSSRSLTLTLDAGEFGPIQDRVRLEQPLVVVAPDSAP